MKTYREESEENAVDLHFPDTWEVLEYDKPKSSFYSGTIKRTGTDLTAVDFVINPQETPARLLLIEVKDFRNHEVENRQRQQKAKKKDCPEGCKPDVEPSLDVEVARKVLHTLAGLYIGTQMKHADLRAIAPAVSPTAERVQAILLLEEDALPQPGPSGHMSPKAMLMFETRQKRKGDLQTNLIRRLKPLKIKAKVYSCQEIPVQEGWHATALPRKRLGT